VTTMMRPEQLQSIGERIFDAAGSPHEESALAMATMVRANLAGHDSHGFLRVPFYTERMQSGQLKPGAPFEVEREAPAMAVVNGHQGWGQVTARQAMHLAIHKARESAVAVVSVRNSQHIGRLGEWVSMAAEENMIGLAFVNSRGGVGDMAPWGGIDRRMNPNPLAFAAPSGEPWPVLTDLTASVVAGGKVEVALFEGKAMSPGCIIDADGNPTTDPGAFFGSPPGALLPLGGPVGHKGYALNVMIDLLAGALTGSGVGGQNRPWSGNGVLFEVLDIAHFAAVEDFIASVQRLMAWVKSSRRAPGVSEILFPGECEYRTTQQRLRDGIPVSEVILEKVAETGRGLGVDVLV
jgi:uncharacterized oxidoreductase